MTAPGGKANMESWRSYLDGRRGHKLMTKEVAKKIPGIGTTDGNGDAFANEVGVKFFCPFGRYTFFVTEFDGEDLLFGYCVSPLGEDCDEWGYASLEELANSALESSFGKVPAIERDCHFGGVTVREALEDHGIAIP